MSEEVGNYGGSQSGSRLAACAGSGNPAAAARHDGETLSRDADISPLTPYYDDPFVTLYHANCMEVMPRVKADLCLTDPPYGVAKAAWDNYLPLDWMQEAARYCEVIAVMPGVWNMLKMPQRVGKLDYRWTLAAHLVNGMTNGAIGYGNWIPCLVWATEGAKLHQQASDIKDIVVGRESKPDHPSPKPLDAMRWFLSRLPGAVVLDPFAGSGTTLLAAKSAGRRAIGIERNEEYCELIASRLSQDVFNFAGGDADFGVTDSNISSQAELLDFPNDQAQRRDEL